MKKIVKLSIATAMLMGMGAVSAQAEDTANLSNVLTNIKVKGEIRPRYEFVDEDNTKPNANALTNRLVLGVGADIAGTDWLKAYAEITDVHSVNNNYNDKDASNGAEANSVVVDPNQTRLTQAYIDVKINKTLLRVGRQLINLDNQRFIGAVGWRQMPQTYDTVMLADNSIEGLDIAAVYVSQINRVHSDNNDETATYAGTAGSWDTRTLLLHGSYKAMDELKITGYAYMIGSLHDTYGLALTGKVKASDSLKITYRAEYATQTDSTMENAGLGEGKADADYMNFELGANMNGMLIGAGYEVLSGEESAGDTSFTTPLATLHGKNGWADIFLLGNGVGAGNTAGLEDMSAYVGYKAKGFGLAKVIYHDFSSEVGSTDFGTEVDAIYKNKVPGVKGLTGMVKFADYNADQYGVDTTKLWLMLDYKFASK